MSKIKERLWSLCLLHMYCQSSPKSHSYLFPEEISAAYTFKLFPNIQIDVYK